MLLQLTEAKRWDFNYGFGFEAQTGNPSTNCVNSHCLDRLDRLYVQPERQDRE